MGSLHGGLGTLFYLIYTVVMTFIVMNMFFTILGEGFSDTQIQVNRNTNKLKINFQGKRTA